MTPPPGLLGRLTLPRYLKEFQRQLDHLSSGRQRGVPLAPSRVATWVLAAEEAAVSSTAGEQDAGRLMAQHRQQALAIAVDATRVDADLLERLLDAYERSTRPPRSKAEGQELRTAYAAEVAAVDAEWERRHPVRG